MARRWPGRTSPARVPATPISAPGGWHHGDVLFGDAIHLQRERRGWSQDELARRLAVTQQSVSRWEAGTAVPPPRRVMAIEDELEIARGTLLRLTGYLPEGQHSDRAGRFRELIALIPELSDQELLLVVDSAWQVFRDRNGFTPAGASPPAPSWGEQTGSARAEDPEPA